MIVFQIFTGIAALADAHSCLDLASSADSFARSHFAEVVQSEEFMMIPQTQLLRLISHDGLNVHSEERVFEAVLAWVKYDVTTREVGLNLHHSSLFVLLRLKNWQKKEAKKRDFNTIEIICENEIHLHCSHTLSRLISKILFLLNFDTALLGLSDFLCPPLCCSIIGRRHKFGRSECSVLSCISVLPEISKA